MIVQSQISLMTCLALCLCSCGGFQSDFYQRIDDAQTSSIDIKDAVVFDLSDITPFEWDSVLIVLGNESIAIEGFEIEPVLKREASSLDTGKDRFYFLNKNKKLIVKELSHSKGRNHIAYLIQPCPRDSKAIMFWLSQSECEFHCISNTDIPGEGTIILFPGCYDKDAWSGFKLLKANSGAQ